VIDHRWRDNFFATFFNSGKVVRVELGREGSTFHATQREFLSATSDDFHPTDVIEDADGSLLVVDTGGWFYRGCPTSQMSKPDVLGGIYRIRRSGMTTQVDPWGSRIDWKALTDAEVIKQLNDTRHPVRRLAIAECARRADSIVPELGRAVRGDLRVRRNAIWALTRIIGDGPSDDAHAAIRETLHDREPSIRQTACRSIATYPDSTALNELISIAGDDPFPQVRREAVKAIGRIGDPDAVAALLTLIADAESADRSEEHALTYALIEINHPDRTRRGLDHPSTRVRRSCLIALDQMENGRLSNLEIARQLESDDAGLRDAAVAILSRVPNFLGEPFTGELTRTIQRIANRLQDRLADSDRDSSAAILPLAGALASAEPVATVIGRFLRAHHTPDQRVVMLDAIAQGDRVPLHDTWKAPLEECLRSADPGLILNAIRATGSLDSDHFDKILKQISADNTQPGTVRVAALKVLSSGDSRWSDGVFDTLLQLLDEGLPTESGQAAQLIAASRLTEFQLVELTKRLPDAGPTVLRDLVRPFGGRLNAAVADSFLDGLSNARSFDRLDVTTVSDSIKRLPAHLLPRANALLDRLKFIDQERIEKLDRLLPMVVDADAEHGEAVFFGAKAKCASCHRVGDRGTAVGPDLTTIGANRSIQDLLESIVFPSASIVRQYESSTLLTRSGQVYAGIITRQTADELSLQQPAGDPIAIKLADIEDHSPSTVSIMPTGIDAAISEQELAALAAWLKNQTGR
jgi:putative heme-binding domain-containing protein